MYPIDRWGWSHVDGVIVVVCMIVRDEGCEVRVVVFIEYSDRVEQGVGYGLILACISDSMLPHCVVHANGRGEVSVVLCDRVRGWGDRCYDGLLRAVGFL